MFRAESQNKELCLVDRLAAAVLHPEEKNIGGVKKASQEASLTSGRREIPDFIEKDDPCLRSTFPKCLESLVVRKPSLTKHLISSDL